MKGNGTEKLIFGIFLAVGLILAGIGVGWLVNSINVSNKALTTTAVITEIDTYRDSDGDRHHNVYISYEVDGVTYDDVRLGEYSSSMYEGKEIEIKYLEDKPGKPYASLWMGPIMLMIMGLIFGLVGGVGFFATLKNKIQGKKLIAEGRCLQATVESIDWNRNYRVNGQSPYVIICTYKDEFSNTVYRFKSGNIWYDPSIKLPVGSLVDVYVDPQDYSKHYVDTEKEYGMGPQVVDFT